MDKENQSFKLDETSRSNSPPPTIKRSSAIIVPIGPNQLVNQLDRLINSVSVEQWKNIPMPVMTATQVTLQCIDQIKRFVISLDTRFTNLTTSAEQKNIDINNSMDAHYKKTIAKIESMRRELQLESELFQEKTERVVTEKEKNMAKSLNSMIQERIDYNQEKLKVWITHKIEDAINISEKRIQQIITKNSNELKEMFQVPNYIGLNCKHHNFREFVLFQVAFVENSLTKLAEHRDELNLNQKFNQSVTKKLNQHEQHLIEVKQEFSSNLAIKISETERKFEDQIKSCQNETEKKIKDLNYGKSQQDLMANLLSKWPQSYELIGHLKQDLITAHKQISSLNERVKPFATISDLEKVRGEVINQLAQHRWNQNEHQKKVDQMQQEIMQKITQFQAANAIQQSRYSNLYNQQQQPIHNISPSNKTKKQNSSNTLVDTIQSVPVLPKQLSSHSVHEQLERKSDQLPQSQKSDNNQQLSQQSKQQKQDSQNQNESIDQLKNEEKVNTIIHSNISRPSEAVLLLIDYASDKAQSVEEHPKFYPNQTAQPENNQVSFLPQSQIEQNNQRLFVDEQQHVLLLDPLILNQTHQSTHRSNQHFQNTEEEFIMQPKLINQIDQRISSNQEVNYQDFENLEEQQQFVFSNNKDIHSGLVTSKSSIFAIQNLIQRIQQLEKQVNRLGGNCSNKKVNPKKTLPKCSSKATVQDDQKSAMAINAAKYQNNSLHTEIMAHSQKGPLRWDTELRKWLNNVNFNTNPDLKIENTTNFTQKVRDSTQCSVLLKEQKQFLKNAELQHSNSRNLQKINALASEDSELYIEAKSVKQLTRYDLSVKNYALSPLEINLDVQQKFNDKNSFNANIQKDYKSVGVVYEPIFVHNKRHSQGRPFSGLKTYIEPNSILQKIELPHTRFGRQTVMKLGQTYQLDKLSERLYSSKNKPKVSELEDFNSTIPLYQN